MTDFLIFFAGAVLGFASGIVIGCLIYSGQHDVSCDCANCRRLRWEAGEDPNILPCESGRHQFPSLVDVGDLCACRKMELRQDGDGARYVSLRDNS